MKPLPFLDPFNVYQSAELVAPPLPPAISMVPQTTGWWWLLAALLLVIAQQLVRLRAKRLRNLWRAEAILIILQAQNEQDISGLYSLLLRIAKLSVPPDVLASMPAELLLTRLGIPLSAEQRMHLLAARYKPAGAVRDDTLYPVLMEWVKKHPHV